jgi:hypothetical protein
VSALLPVLPDILIWGRLLHPSSGLHVLEAATLASLCGKSAYLGPARNTAPVSNPERLFPICRGCHAVLRQRFPEVQA